jgi:hypothetical protein
MMLIERNQAIAVFSGVFAALFCSSIAALTAIRRRKGRW